MTDSILTQIYEIQTIEEAKQVRRTGVDHIGSVIVSAANWKQPSIKETIQWVQRSSARSSLILLYQTPDLVFSSLDYYRPDIVHFCEMLMDPHTMQFNAAMIENCMELQAKIRDRFPEIKIMRSIPIPETGNAQGVDGMHLARLFEPITDFFLTDTVVMDGPSGGGQPVNGFIGITGKTCDWDMAALLVAHSRIPVFLAGGLSADNVFEGIQKVHPAGVDSCTLTNATGPDGRPVRFKKDMEKVKRFVAEVRRAERAGG